MEERIYFDSAATTPLDDRVSQAMQPRLQKQYGNASSPYRAGLRAGDALRPNTRLVSVMAAKNVVGTLQPMHHLRRIAREHGAIFHATADPITPANRLPY